MMTSAEMLRAMGDYIATHGFHHQYTAPIANTKCGCFIHATVCLPEEKGVITPYDTVQGMRALQTLAEIVGCTPTCFSANELRRLGWDGNGPEDITMDAAAACYIAADLAE